MPTIPAVAGIPIDFILFACVLIGVALFHHHTLRVAVTGLAVITVYKVLWSPFHGVPVPGHVTTAAGGPIAHTVRARRAVAVT